MPELTALAKSQSLIVDTNSAISSKEHFPVKLPSVTMEALLAYEMEAVEPTTDDIAELQVDPMILHYPSNQPPKFKKRGKRDSLRSRVQVDLAKIDHTICGPPCKTVPVPEQILLPNTEYKSLFP